MKKVSRILVVVLGLMSQACAMTKYRTQQFDQVLQSYLGKSERTVVANFGAPTSVYDMNSSGKVLTYIQDGGSRSFYQHNAFMNLGQVVTRNNSCKIDFVIDALGTVESYKWQGNGCQ